MDKIEKRTWIAYAAVTAIKVGVVAVGLFATGAHAQMTRNTAPILNGIYGPYPEETYTTYGPSTGRTAAIVVHGGWTSSGSDAMPAVVELSQYLARQGIFAVTVNYRLDRTHPGQGHPAQLQDIQLAIRELHKGGFTNVGVIGLSAGGFIALSADFAGGTDHWWPTDPKREVLRYPEQSSMPAWVVSVSGFWDLNAGNLNPTALGYITQNIAPADANLSQATVYGIASPISHMKTGAPPLLVFHGVNDNVIPVSQAQNANVLCSSIICNARFEYTTGGHVFAGLHAFEKGYVFSKIAAFATTGGKFQ